MTRRRAKADFPLVISASRMCDLPQWYQQYLIHEIKQRLETGRTLHSLVIWTKHPLALLKSPLYDELSYLKSIGIQLYFQITITGMGNRVCGYDKFQRPWRPEPIAPSKEESVKILPQLISLTEHPLRIRLRIDPILQVKDIKGEFYSNYEECKDTIEKCSALGIRKFSFSFVEPGIYRKVDRRFQQLGITLIKFDEILRNKIRYEFSDLEKKLGVDISGCCIEDWPVSSCINGRMLQQLHPQKLDVSLCQPHSRPLCGCTASIDIGGWPPKTCPTGCDYCYARPFYRDLKEKEK